MKFKYLLLLFFFSTLLYANQIYPQNLQESEETMLLDSGRNLPEGEQAADDIFGSGELNTFTFMDFLRMILILLFVILCIYGVFFLLKKAGAARFDDNEMINILSSKNIAPNKNIHVIEVGNQIFMVGSSENTLNLIAEITEKETIDRFRLIKSENKAPVHKTFYNYMLDVMGSGKKGGKKEKDSFNEINSSDFIKKQREKMEKL